jgi:hypothetical protein
LPTVNLLIFDAVSGSLKTTVTAAKENVIESAPLNVNAGGSYAPAVGRLTDPKPIAEAKVSSLPIVKKLSA